MTDRVAHCASELMSTTLPRPPSLDGPKRLTYLGIAVMVVTANIINLVMQSLAASPSAALLGLSALATVLGLLLLLLAARSVKLQDIELLALGIFFLLVGAYDLALLLPGTPPDTFSYGALLLITLGAATYLRLPPPRATPLLASMLGLHLVSHWWRLLWPQPSPDLAGQLSRDLTAVVALSLIALLGAHRAAWLDARDSARAMRDIALSDDLTGLPNRRAAYRRFGDAMRDPRTPVSVLLLDIDDFKQINDAHGHEVGDQVIRAIAQTLQSSLGKSGMLVRWGGEEFLALLSGASLSPAVREAEALREAVEGLRLPCGPLTVSVGVASRLSKDTVQSLVHRADQGLYHAKESGKNRVTAQED